MDKFCAYCGRKIPETARYYARRKYCSEKCRYRDVLLKAKNLKKFCAYCGKEFVAHSTGKKYCSPECKKAAHPQNFGEKTCPECGKTFTAHRIGHVFCSTACFKINYKKRNSPRYKKTCPVCGKTFTTNFEQKKFCSGKCADASWAKRKTPKQDKCPICGKTFVRTNGGQKYCSPECSAEGNRRNNLERAKRKRLPKGQRKCPVCGKIFQIDDKNHITKFCSKECRNFNPKAKKKPDRVLDVQKKAALCGLSYGQYRVQTDVFGKTFEELRLKHLKEKLLGSESDE